VAEEVFLHTPPTLFFQKEKQAVACVVIFSKTCAESMMACFSPGFLNTKERKLVQKMVDGKIHVWTDFLEALEKLVQTGCVAARPSLAFFKDC
jgi:hypothetical protein